MEPVGSALMASGVGALVYGSIRNWQDPEQHLEVPASARGFDIAYLDCDTYQSGLSEERVFGEVGIEETVSL